MVKYLSLGLLEMSLGLGRSGITIQRSNQAISHLNIKSARWLAPAARGCSSDSCRCARIVLEGGPKVFRERAVSKLSGASGVG